MIKDGLQSMNCRFVITIFCVLFSTITSAKNVYLPLVPLPSVPDYTKTNGWTNTLGIQFGSSAIYKGADHYALDLNPEGAMQYRKGNHLFFWEGFNINTTEVGWRGLLKDNWLLKAAALHEIVIPTSRSEKAGIDNLPHRGSHILGMIDLKYSIGYEWKNWIACQFLGGPSRYGWQTKLAAGHLFSQQAFNNGTEIVLFATFGDTDNFNDYFGVTELDSDMSGLQAIELEGGHRSTGLDFYYRKGIGRHTQMLVKAGVELYSDEIQKSELLQETAQTYFNIAFVWGK